jgi:hypothetical protein
VVAVGGARMPSSLGRPAACPSSPAGRPPPRRAFSKHRQARLPASGAAPVPPPSDPCPKTPVFRLGGDAAHPAGFGGRFGRFRSWGGGRLDAAGTDHQAGGGTQQRANKGAFHGSGKSERRISIGPVPPPDKRCPGHFQDTLLPDLWGAVSPFDAGALPATSREHVLRHPLQVLRPRHLVPHRQCLINLAAPHEAPAFPHPSFRIVGPHFPRV